MASQPADLGSAFRRSLFDPQQFTLTFELVPSRGGHSKGQSRLMELARLAAADGRLQAVSITENAGGHPALSPEVLAEEIQGLGLEVINHFSCKDKNRNQMESLLFSWDRLGLHNLLVLSGDYPQGGYQGRPKPVFDLDSVQALALIGQMNQGRLADQGRNAALEFTPTSFLRGVALSPFKLLPSELFLQYAKLHRKVRVGADYIITQLDYDARKFHEVLLYLRLNGFNLPVLGNVFIPNLTVARLMHQGAVPGCVIPEALYRQILSEAAAPDRGRRARLVRAARLLAVLKGLGYAGAHIGGPGLTFADLDLVLNLAHELAGNWREEARHLSYWPEGAAYYFLRDPDSGLNLPRLDPALTARPSGLFPAYEFSRLVHEGFFVPQGAGFPLARRCCLGMERGGQAALLMRIEHTVKLLLFGCQNCGDCRLAELAFLCPQAGCAKYMLNGPCGGSQNGWCEVYPGRRRCFYVRIHERLAAHGLTETLRAGFLPPRDWARNHTSSWLNFFKDLEAESGLRSD